MATHIPPSPEKIEAFWEWFRETEPILRTYFEDEATVNKQLLIESMNNRVLDFGLFTWEIGQGHERPYYLIISPNRDRERLATSRRLIQAAPPFPQWELLPAHPPKAVDFQLKVYDSYMRICEVDASEWIFALLDADPYGIELVLKAPSMGHLDEDTQFDSAEKLISDLIGEAWATDYIEDLVLVSEFEEAEAAVAHPIQQMRFRVEEWLG